MPASNDGDMKMRVILVEDEETTMAAPTPTPSNQPSGPSITIPFLPPGRPASSHKQLASCLGLID